MTTETQTKKEEKAVIAWQEGKITVTASDVRNYLCPKATEPEIVLFLKTCQSFGLNPWVHEAYLVKYKEGEPAAIIIAAEAYLKASEICPEFDGLEAGIILRDNTGKLEFREGAFVADGEESRLAGGFARVYRKDRQRPFYIAVNIKECQKYTREGKPTRFWREMPGTMVRKVALSRALREAFPTRLGGIYTTAEYEEIPAGELPPAYQKPNGEAYWKKFWARQKEKGLSEDDVHNMLGISSLKTDWLEQGRTLEEAEGIINKALEQRTKPKKAAAGKSNYQPVTTDMPDAAAEQAFTPPAPPKVTPKQDEWRAFWDQAEGLGLPQDQVHEMLGVTSLKEWTDQGKTLDEAIKVISEKLAQTKPASESATTGDVAGEGFSIDMTWLKESLDKIKWTEATAWSFIVSQYKVDDSGTFIQTLKRLTREQAEEFVQEVTQRLERQLGLL